MERPTGVTVLSVLNFIGAAFYVLGALGIFMGGAFLANMTRSSPQGGAGMTAMIAGLGAVLGVICLIGAGLCLLVGIGLWKLANWARILQIVLLALGVCFGLFGLFGSLMNFHAGQLIWQLIFLAIYIWIIVYLFKPHVKQAFGATSL
jgi:hypothetical protein